MRWVGARKAGLDPPYTFYAAAIPLAFAEPRASCAMYVAVAVMWLVPDRQIEMILSERRS